MLEEFVSARAGNALDALAKLLPDQVTVRQNGEDRVVPLKEVKTSDIILIRSPELIPVDGTVVFGTASINQAAITGESLAIEKQPGDSVFAGTLNELGTLEVQTSKVGEETTLGQIRRMVAEAQEQKAPTRSLQIAALVEPLSPGNAGDPAKPGLFSRRLSHCGRTRHPRDSRSRNGGVAPRTLINSSDRQLSTPHWGKSTKGSMIANATDLCSPRFTCGEQRYILDKTRRKEQQRLCVLSKMSKP